MRSLSSGEVRRTSGPGEVYRKLAELFHRSARLTPVRVEQDLAAAINRLPAAFRSDELRKAFEDLVDLDDSDIDEDTLLNLHACARLRAKFLASSVETRCAIGRMLLPFVNAKLRKFGKTSDEDEYNDLVELITTVAYLRESTSATRLRTSRAIERERNVVLPILQLDPDKFRVVFGPSLSSLRAPSSLRKFLDLSPVPTLLIPMDDHLPSLRRDVCTWINTLHDIREDPFPRKKEVFSAANLMVQEERKVGIDGVEGLNDAVLDCVLRCREIRLEREKGSIA